MYFPTHRLTHRRWDPPHPMLYLSRPFPSSSFRSLCKVLKQLWFSEPKQSFGRKGKKVAKYHFHFFLPGAQQTKINLALLPNQGSGPITGSATLKLCVWRDLTGNHSTCRNLTIPSQKIPPCEESSRKSQAGGTWWENQKVQITGLCSPSLLLYCNKLTSCNTGKIRQLCCRDGQFSWS